MKDEPVIYFAKGVHYRFRRLAKIGADVLGFDWTIDLGRARERVGDKVAVQGNLDPTTLFADKNIIAERAMAILESYGKGSGHIFNEYSFSLIATFENIPNLIEQMEQEIHNEPS